MEWSPYSPDLNPIETVWNWMKDYIEDKYGLEENPPYDRLRLYVQEAWDAVPEEWLRELIAEMPRRCRAVIEANGMHTRY
jgi:transposase